MSYLAGDPYDLAALLRTLLAAHANAQQGQVEQGQIEQGHAILQAMAVRCSFSPLLAGLRSGALLCHQLEGHFWLLPADFPAAALPDCAAQLARALHFGSQHLAVPVPQLVLHLSPDFAAMSYAAFDVAGLALLQFPLLLWREQRLARWLWHETGHCHLRCGLRFLDEGLAAWFEYSHVTGQFDAAAAQQALQHVHPLPLAELLQPDFSQALAFEDAVSDEAQRAAIYPQGALLIDALWQRIGAAGLQQLFAALRQDSSQLPTLLRSALAEEWGSWLTRWDAAAQASGPALACTRADVLAARARGDQAALHAMLQELGTPDTVAQQVLFVDILITLCELRAEPDKALLRQADSLLAALMKGPGSIALQELQLRQTMTRLMRASSVMERASLGTRAMRQADAILQQQPGSCDAQLCKATLLIHTPPQYGGDVDAGSSLLRQLARRKDDHAGVAAAIFRQTFKEEPFSTPPQPVPEPVPQDGQEPVTASAALAVAGGEDALPASAATVAAAASAQPSAGPLLFSLREMHFAPNADLTLQVDALDLHGGEMVGLIGPNGAGKSLLLECCVGLQRISSSRHQLCGLDVAQWQADLKQRALVGAKLHRLGFEPDYLVADIVQLMRAAYGRVPDSLLQRFALGPLLKKKYGWLSSGQKQRVDLCLAFHPGARLFFLDEPTLGLDDEFSLRLFDTMREQVAAGASLLVASHEAAFLARCQRIAILAAGRLQVCDTPEALRARYLSEYRVDVALDAHNLSHLTALRQLPALQQVQREEQLILLGDVAFLRAFHALAAQHALLNYQLRASTLSDLYTVATRFAPDTAG